MVTHDYILDEIIESVKQKRGVTLEKRYLTMEEEQFQEASMILEETIKDSAIHIRTIMRKYENEESISFQKVIYRICFRIQEIYLLEHTEYKRNYESVTSSISISSSSPTSSSSSSSSSNSISFENDKKVKSLSNTINECIRIEDISREIINNPESRMASDFRYELTSPDPKASISIRLILDNWANIINSSSSDRKSVSQILSLCESPGFQSLWLFLELETGIRRIMFTEIFTKCIVYGKQKNKDVNLSGLFIGILDTMMSVIGKYIRVRTAHECFEFICGCLTSTETNLESKIRVNPKELIANRLRVSFGIHPDLPEFVSEWIINFQLNNTSFASALVKQWISSSGLESILRIPALYMALSKPKAIPKPMSKFPFLMESRKC
jgi:hypothetical protein